ncbi:BTB/POZ domain containing protein [Trypanosoma rangeli]|uniref:BTB/POZ domain containing protein n=1 Tax=Trypanosoma rangeli TaxID=5698 RepID=A0A3R7N7F9_TRYRA|nr:BTB/POZ domain containing protein [Trypanosoma rangeli]RNF01549.1 BTB/POZ domain containing protein [Trypanosoma rangeli]|eukprot:RNF01549.1 BTB/POZ domain containing protein [Trypanosoma rangeli]
MDFGLEGHTATLCGDLIVVVGGKTAAFCLNESVLTLTLPGFEWRQLPCDGAIPAPRAYHSTCLHGTRLVVFGGITSVGLNDVHYNTYNVFTLADGLDGATLRRMGADRFCDPSRLRPLMPQKMEPDGAVHILDTSASPPRWESAQCTGNVPCNRSHHAAAVQGNAMYIVGGYNIYSSQAQPAVDFGCLYRLDLTTLCWTSIRLSTPLYYWGATLTPLGGPLLCLFGGVSRARNMESRDTFFLDAQTGSVQPVLESSCTPSPRAAHCAWRWGCYVYIFGGAGSVATRYFNDLHRLYVQRGAWEEVTTHVETKTLLSSSTSSASPPPLSGSAAVVVGEHVIFVGGMRSNLTRLSSVFLVSMHSLTWQEAKKTFTDTPLSSTFAHNRPHSRRGGASIGVQTTWKGGSPLVLSHDALDPVATLPRGASVMQQPQHQLQEGAEEGRHSKERPQERWERELSELRKLTADWSNVIVDPGTRLKGVAWSP